MILQLNLLRGIRVCGLILLSTLSLSAEAAMQCVAPSGIQSMDDCYQLNVRCINGQSQTLHMFMDGNYSAAEAGELYCQKYQNSSAETAKKSKLDVSECLADLNQGCLKAVCSGALTELKAGDCKRV